MSLPTMMLVCVAFTIVVTLVWIIMAVLLKIGIIGIPGGYGRSSKQTNSPLSPKQVLNLLKTSQLFPVGPAQGWMLSSFRHGHRVWSAVITTTSTNDKLTLYSAYTKVDASAQVLLQLLRDVTRTVEWCPRVIKATQTSPVTMDTTPKRKSYSQVPVQYDKVSEVFQLRDSLLEDTAEGTFFRIWHREDNGCCWMLKMAESSHCWTFFLAQPAQDAEHSLLTVISPDEQNSDVTLGVATILGCLDDQLSHRKTEFTPLLSITLPQTPLGDCDSTKPSVKHRSKNNNNSSEEDSVFPPTGLQNNKDALLCKKTETIEKMAKESESGSSDEPRANSSGKTSSSQLKDYVLKYEKNNKSETSQSSEDVAWSLTEVTEDLSTCRSRVRRAESDSNLLKKSNHHQSPSSNSFCEDFTPKSAEQRRKTNLMISANQTRAEVLTQTFKASSVDVSKLPSEPIPIEKCPGGWMFTGLDSDVVVLKRLFKSGMSTQSYLGKGIIHANPKTVFDAIKNPRMKFTYDETLKKVDILENVSDTIKIVYFYHEVQQLFWKESCDFCVLQSERLDGEKYILSLHSIESEWAPKLQGTQRAKLLPSGWIIEPVKTDKKTVSMVTFLMQIDMGPAKNGASLPFEDVASRQPLAIVQLREYFKPLTTFVERQNSQ